jgi:DNA-binding NarL/FixJ family response regulator
MSGHPVDTGRRLFKVVLRCRDGLLRDALSNWVGTLPGYTVAGASATGAGLLRLCALLSPDVAVVELRTAGPDELDLLACLRERRGPHVVGLHRGLDARTLAMLHRAGVNRLVSTRFGVAGLRDALKEAEDIRVRAVPGGLTERELEVLALICAGCSAAEIAEALAISPHTVTNHKRRIFAKLEVQSRTQAAAEAGRLGLRLPGSVSRDHSEEAPRNLTRRERDILDSIAKGDSVRQTAQSLGIAIKTVQCEQRQLFTKLGARNRPQALTHARRFGLVET